MSRSGEDSLWEPEQTGEVAPGTEASSGRKLAVQGEGSPIGIPSFATARTPKHDRRCMRPPPRRDYAPTVENVVSVTAAEANCNFDRPNGHHSRFRHDNRSRCSAR
jgi:hypothetical protein